MKKYFFGMVVCMMVVSGSLWARHQALKSQVVAKAAGGDEVWKRLVVGGSDAAQLPDYELLAEAMEERHSESMLAEIDYHVLGQWVNDTEYTRPAADEEIDWLFLKDPRLVFCTEMRQPFGGLLSSPDKIAQQRDKIKSTLFRTLKTAHDKNVPFVGHESFYKLIQKTFLDGLSSVEEILAGVRAAQQLNFWNDKDFEWRLFDVFLNAVGCYMNTSYFDSFDRRDFSSLISDINKARTYLEETMSRFVKLKRPSFWARHAAQRLALKAYHNCFMREDKKQPLWSRVKELRLWNMRILAKLKPFKDQLGVEEAAARCTKIAKVEVDFSWDNVPDNVPDIDATLESATSPRTAVTDQPSPSQSATSSAPSVANQKSLRTALAGASPLQSKAPFKKSSPSMVSRNAVIGVGGGLAVAALARALYLQVQIMQARQRLAHALGVPVRSISPKLAARALAGAAQRDAGLKGHDRIAKDIASLQSYQTRRTLTGLGGLGVGAATALAAWLLHRRTAAAG